MSDSKSPPQSPKMSLREWRRWIRPVVLGLYIILFLVTVPLVSVYLENEKTQPATETWLIAMIFVIFTIPISFWTILQHLIYYTQPELQKHIIRILWMVPIYSIDSLIALIWPPLAIYFDTARECYEAYVIYNFMAYLLNYLSKEYELAGTLGAKPQQKHLIPFCCLSPWPMGGIFIERCKQGVLQYTILRPITTVIALICELSGAYHEGEFYPQYAWVWIVLINNASQLWAMYCLILFYMAAKEELKPIKPVAKFWCVKLVVFASFWQAVAIAIIVQFIPFKPAWGWEKKDELANGLQDFIICVEMLVAAIAHHFSFSYQPFVTSEHNIPWYRSFRSMWDVSDVRKDVANQVRDVTNRVMPTRPQWLRTSKSGFVDDEQKYSELSSLLTPSSSDGEMANILGYGERPQSYASHNRVSDKVAPVENGVNEDSDGRE